MKKQIRIRRLAIGAVAVSAVIVASITGLAATRPTTNRLPAASGLDAASEPLPPIATFAPYPIDEMDAVEFARGEDFAREVAYTLFNWDTTATSRAEVNAGLVELADEHEINGLAADLDAFLPTQATWARLAEMQTRQTLEIRELQVPESWSRVVAENRDAIPEGAVAYNITGIRRREGTVNGESQVLELPISFTLFASCTPAGESCWLLRLSAPGNPLD